MRGGLVSDAATSDTSRDSMKRRLRRRRAPSILTSSPSPTVSAELVAIGVDPVLAREPGDRARDGMIEAALGRGGQPDEVRARTSPGICHHRERRGP
jgi:hypothetical protein